MSLPEQVWKNCRWSNLAAVLFAEDDWEVFFDASESDYQGTVEIMARFTGYSYGDVKSYKYLEYSYGSCSGCDAWEGQPVEKALTDMMRSVLPLDAHGAAEHLQRIADSASDGYDERDRAAKARVAKAWLQEKEAEESR